MFTSNGEILRRLEALNKQWNDTHAEIEMRIKQKRVDNDGYIITENQSGTYSLVSNEFFMESLKAMVGHANEQLK
jgi:hypothetical protein